MVAMSECVASRAIGGVVRRRSVVCDACRRGTVGGVHSYIRGGGISQFIHIRRGVCGQRLGGGCGRRCGVVLNAPANVREKGRYAPGSGNRPEILFDLYKPFDHESQT